MPYDLNKLPSIAHAELTIHRFRGGDPSTRHCVGGAVQKAVLWAVWCFEGDRVALAAIASRAGTSMGSASRAILAMLRNGVLIVDKDVGRTGRGGLTPRSYRVSMERLDELRSAIPLRAESLLFVAARAQRNKQGR